MGKCLTECLLDTFVPRPWTMGNHEPVCWCSVQEDPFPRASDLAPAPVHEQLWLGHPDW